MKTIGFVLVLCGLLALVYGGIRYSRQRVVLDVGPFQTSATEQRSIPLSPIAGGIVLIGGILLMANPKNRLA